MSDIMEKTLASIPVLILGQKNGSSRYFNDFIKGISSLKTKDDEQEYFQKQLAHIEKRLSQPGLLLSDIKELLICCLFCELYGFPTPFAHINAVKLAHHGSLPEKKAGYLLSSLFLHDNHEFSMLLINTIQKDLQSKNIVENCMALTMASYMLNSDLIPALLPSIETKMAHRKSIVRKKAVLCLLAFYRKSPECIFHNKHNFMIALCDKDPGVMWAALHFFEESTKLNVEEYPWLTESLIGILKQIIDHKMPSDFEFNSIPSPWLQITILKILSRLGQDSEERSNMIYGTLRDILQRTNSSKISGLAVMYECILITLNIYKNEVLIEEAASCLANYLSAKSIDLKYMGLKGLAHVVLVDVRYVVTHQDVIIDCLKHRDSSIRLKVLDILYQIGNESNVKVICEQMLNIIDQQMGDTQKKKIIERVADLSKRLRNDDCWYFDILCKLMQKDSNEATSHYTQEIINFVKSENNDVLKNYSATKSYNHLINHKDHGERLSYAIWIISRYGIEGVLTEDIINHLTKVFSDPKSTEVVQRNIIDAFTWISQEYDILYNAINYLKCFIDVKHTYLLQRYNELCAICDLKKEKKFAFSYEISKSEMDFTLSFLDKYVVDSLNSGFKPYNPKMAAEVFKSMKTEEISLSSGLNFNPFYSNQSMQSSYSSFMGHSNVSHHSISSTSLMNEPGLNVKDVKKVWSKDGFLYTSENQSHDFTSKGHHKSFSEGNIESNDVKPKFSDSIKNTKMKKELFRGIKSFDEDIYQDI